MDFVIISLRYILLLILYLFIFRVIFLIIRDIKDSRSPSVHEISEYSNTGGQIEGQTSSGLVIVRSDVPDLVEGKKIELHAENYIGRGPENNIQILDNFTSHRHARLSLKKGQFWLEDLASKNGTFIGGIRLEKPVTLINGDLFQVGGVTFRFERWA